MAMMSPVLMSWTMTTPHSALSLSRWLWMACWAKYWRSEFRVSLMSLPFTAGVSWSTPTGMRSPSAPISKSRLPGVPFRISSWVCSRPAWPVVPSFRKPTIPPATEPLGYTRLLVPSVTMPGIWSLEMRSSTSGFTSLATM